MCFDVFDKVQGPSALQTHLDHEKLCDILFTLIGDLVPHICTFAYAGAVKLGLMSFVSCVLLPCMRSCAMLVIPMAGNKLHIVIFDGGFMGEPGKGTTYECSYGFESL
jgi:hypothetical protein